MDARSERPQRGHVQARAGLCKSTCQTAGLTGSGPFYRRFGGVNLIFLISSTIWPS